MQDGLQDRANKAVWMLVLFISAVTLVACVGENPTETDTETVVPATTATVEKKEEGESRIDIPEGSVDMDDKSKELIKDALSCDDKGAELILIELNMNGLSFPLSKAERVEEDSNDLIILDNDSVEYYVMVNKKYDVDMIKDVKADKIIYAVYE